MARKKALKDNEGEALYRVVVSGRDVLIEKVDKGDPDYTTAHKHATTRLVEAMRIMRDQETDLSRLDSTHYFQGLVAAKDYARMCFKDLSETLALTWDAVESYDGTLASSAMLKTNALKRRPPPGHPPDVKSRNPVPDLDAD
ncbi:MAG: hypothetical protein H7841_12625 [Magnetospirillum sp. WYHS-4]